MAPRALKLGTRRSALARAQSAAVARQLERLHPGLTVELVGIETRGDRILDAPLSTVEGKEFFTDELDAALLSGQVDFTVHSYKDLSLERSSRLLLAAVPRRELPHDIAVFAADVPGRLAAGQELLIGSSSPRRASFVPEFLQRVLPRRAADRRSLGRVRLVDLRGNVDSRLSRLREPRGSTRHLDGIVLAFAGLARLWADAAGLALLRELLSGLPRMVLPLSECPAAPAQGALAVECRRDDAETAARLHAIDHWPTRAAVGVERALLAQRGGGCHQRFGATQIELPGVGALLYLRDGGESGARLEVGAPQPRWTPETPLNPPHEAIKAWDGSRAERPGVEPIEAGVARSAERLRNVTALFVTHRRALPEGDSTQINSAAHVWVPGIDTWQALADRGVWVEGCGEGLGFAALEPMLAEPLLQLPPRDQWTVLTHAEAAAGWPAGDVIATYRHGERAAAGDAAGAPPADATHVYWFSSAQFERWRGFVGPGAQHACGPGKTYEHLRRAGVQNLRVFPQPAHWRQWLGV
ncbi:MAG: hydroxymethylbilane synthase [Steroidobacterales bacterium]|jgi:hydroxymethylbilane synthase